MARHSESLIDDEPMIGTMQMSVYMTAGCRFSWLALAMASTSGTAGTQPSAKKPRTIQPAILAFCKGRIVPAIESKKAGPGRPKKITEGDEAALDELTSHLGASTRYECITIMHLCAFNDSH